MSKKALLFSVVILAVLLLLVCVVCGVQYEKFQRLYHAVMIATNDPKTQLVLQPSVNPVSGSVPSLLIHGIYGAQRFAKKQDPVLSLPPPMTVVLFSSDGGIVVSLDNNNNMYVLFRGTLFDYEWKHDFDYVQVPVSIGAQVGQVHKGFQKMYLTYQPFIKKYVATHKPTQLFVAGHSLGAALSLLTAYDMSSFVTKITCVTFAPPKVGDADFVASFLTLTNVTLDQFVNEADLVPLIPLSVMPNSWVPKKPLYYEHIQPEKFHLFNINNKSWQNNHSLVLHMMVVDQNLATHSPPLSLPTLPK